MTDFCENEIKAKITKVDMTVTGQHVISMYYKLFVLNLIIEMVARSAFVIVNANMSLRIL